MKICITYCGVNVGGNRMYFYAPRTPILLSNREVQEVEASKVLINIIITHFCAAKLCDWIEAIFISQINVLKYHHRFSATGVFNRLMRVTVGGWYLARWAKHATNSLILSYHNILIQQQRRQTPLIVILWTNICSGDLFYLNDCLVCRHSSIEQD